jgi:hypothetical protein
MSTSKDMSLLWVAITIFFSHFLLLMPVKAQDSHAFGSKGTCEVGGAMSYSYSTEINLGTEIENSKRLAFQPYAGYFLLDNFEIGLNPIGVSGIWLSGASLTVYSMFVAPSYHVKLSEMVYPFIEGQFGYMFQRNTYTSNGADASTNRDGLCWGGRIGTKLLLGGRVLLNLGIQYEQVTLNEKSSQKRDGTDETELLAGFSFWF